ncbi:MAG: LPS export ABC transporter periplasmic protein LptC [Thermodesulfobacteriota bacterium]|nr:LPS export ABC transporter periplasmic protein LptC [Thermodesulfobacteriota bacterium]
MKKTKLFLVSLVALLIFTVVWISLINYNRKGNLEDPPDMISTKADLLIKNVHYVNTNCGKKEWELKANSGQYFKDQELAIFKDVSVKIFFKNGEHVTLVGDEGEIATNTGDVEIRKNVVLNSGLLYHFEANSLKYDLKKRKITSPDKIFFNGYGMSLEGVGICIDIDREKFFVLNNVSTIIKAMKAD